MMLSLWREKYQQPVPVLRHWKLFVLVVVDGAAEGDVTMGTGGTAGAGFPTIPTVGATVIVGTTGAELTPRLLISVEPNGRPVRATPPGAVGDVEVGIDDAATLVDPEPHIPDMPEVCSIPEVVDIGDVADIPEEVDIPEDIDIPDAAAVAGAAAPAAVPPPS
jgi:hypothetical protein